MTAARSETLVRTILAASMAWALWAAPLAQDSAPTVHDYLAKNKFSAADVASLEAGQVVARVDADRSSGSEIFVVAAVKIRMPRREVATYYGQVIAYVDGEITQAFGRFSTPPALGDVAALAFDRGEIDQLKSCRPGKCDIRLGGAAIEALRTSVDWKAAGYEDQANAFARKAAVDYVTAYQARGDAALITFDDRAKPVSLTDEWRGIVANSPHLQDYAPELRAYLERFPNESLAGARDIFYWVKGSFGLAPVIGIVHGVVYEPPSRPDRTMVVQKQLYASHYLDASLGIATLLDTQDAGRPATYLVYTNRSRGDLLRGGFGGMKRNVARSQARRAAEDTLAGIKRMLESSPGL